MKNILKSTYRTIVSLFSFGDKYFIAKDVPTPKLFGHTTWRNYLYEIGNKPNMRILEIDSREVTGSSVDREKFSQATYVGFDYYAGNNVDVVGDAISYRVISKKMKNLTLFIPPHVLNILRCLG